MDLDLEWLYSILLCHHTQFIFLPSSSAFFFFSPCEDCVTESVNDCICSLPHQCYVSQDNLLDMIQAPHELGCRTICENYTNKTCQYYNYYDIDHVHSPQLCVLLTSCSALVQDTCAGCHLGPTTCSGVGDTCQLALWSVSGEESLVVTDNTTTRVRMMSGEPGCTREVTITWYWYSIGYLQLYDWNQWDMGAAHSWYCTIDI